ncbi:MAG: hypothetical protein K9W42_10435 [Candidatus Heimdallarchaeota archaeon]|nr:hypothetical protein [Candidatus Heimdallarchaeota archaeon]
MSGYNHTINFKVLIDSEVIDFTFKVPRGTLLIQLLDELETTLKVQPKVVAIINLQGEVIVLENHYSAVDYLVQKYGTEFYAGEASFVTFNYGNYIVDLEVPESIPFAATYRTACKSLELKTREVGIERQDGQVMDYEVFSLPTAFVLNSWGNYYKLVSRESGDVYVEPVRPKPVEEAVKPESPLKDEMVYPPKLDGSDIIEVAKELIDVSPLEESEVDQITQNYIDRLEEEPRKEEVLSTEAQVEGSEEFLTKAVEPTEEVKANYPWEKETISMSESEVGSGIEEKPTEDIEQLMDEISIEDEVEKTELFEEEKSEEEYESIPPLEELTEKPIEPRVVDKTTIAEVFRGIMAEEEEESELRKGPLEPFEAEQPLEVEEPAEEFAEAAETQEEVLTFEDEMKQLESKLSTIEKETEEAMIPSYDLPEVSDTERITTVEELETREESEGFSEAQATQEEFVQEASTAEEPSYTIPYIQEEKEEEAKEPVEEKVEETTEREEKPSLQPVLETSLQEEPLEEEITPVERQEEEAPAEEGQAIAEQPVVTTPPPAPSEVLSLDDRLQQKQEELKTLQAAIIEEEQTVSQPPQITISIDYYERMYPQKIYPLIITLPKRTIEELSSLELRLAPRLPGCYVTPNEELLEFDGKTDTKIEFNITPLVKRGKISGKIGLWAGKKNLINLNIISKVISPFWMTFFGILGLFTGIFGVLAFVFNLNTIIATKVGNAGLANAFLGVELGLFILFISLTIGLAFGFKPNKKTTRRKFTLK